MNEQEILERIEIERQIDFLMGRERKYVKPTPKHTPQPKAEPKPNLHTRPDSLAKLFEVAASLPRTQAVQYLAKNKHAAVLQIGRCVLDPNIEFTVTVPAKYQPAMLSDQSLSLYQETRRLYLFCTDPQRESPLQNDPVKCQRRFEDMLHSLLADEASLLCQIVQKRLPIDATLLLDAYPELRHLETVNVNRPSTIATDHFRREMHEGREALEAINRQIQETEETLANLHAQKNRILQGIHRAEQIMGNAVTGGNRFSA